jgi:hypothetical protein
MMISEFELRRDPVTSLDDIEKQMERAVASQRADIEKLLAEKINREKEDAQRKIEEAEREFTGVRTTLAEHRAAMLEFQTAKDNIQSQIREHLDRAGSHRRMIEKISLQAGEELVRIGDLEHELEGIKARAEEKIAAIGRHLDERYGVKAEFEAAFDIGTVPDGWSHEIHRMKKILEILAAENGGEAQEKAEAEAPSVDAVPSPAPDSAPVTASAVMDTHTGELQIPLEVQVEQVMAHEAEPAKPAVPDETQGEEFRGLLGSLERYRRTEPVVNGTEFAFFQNNGQSILDSEYLISTMAKIFAEASALHAELKQKESIKDVFMIKQEILNQQEIMRKIFFRAVKFCEKEEGSLPLYISTVINVPGLKDFLERLTMGNWSNASDFTAFMNEAAELKNTFEGRVTRRRDYVQSVLDQVEGRVSSVN